MCRCVSASVPGSAAETLVSHQRERASRVVLGRVVRIDTLPPYMVEHGPNLVKSHALAARVAVARIWKGPRVDTLTVVFRSIGIASSCDLVLETGSSYVIFASGGEDGVLRTRQCTGTARERDATITIAALGPGQEPKK
jgi:hypothetical protein